MKFRILLFCAVVTLPASGGGVAAAQQAVTATIAANIRSGPGSRYPVVGVIAADGRAELHGCRQNRQWCEISFGGMRGWVYAPYLAGIDGQNSGAVAGSAGSSAADGDAAGAVSGDGAENHSSDRETGDKEAGDREAGDGGMAPATADLAGGPPADVRAYVEAHELTTVRLQGDVVIGAGVPDDVELHPIPGSKWLYVNVNDRTALVRADDRRIVYVFP